MNSLLQNWAIKNILTAILLLGVLLLIKRLAKREYWRLAAREIRQKKTAMISFWILCLYLLIALLHGLGRWLDRLYLNQASFKH